MWDCSPNVDRSAPGRRAGPRDTEGRPRNHEAWFRGHAAGPRCPSGQQSVGHRFPALLGRFPGLATPWPCGLLVGGPSGDIRIARLKPPHHVKVAHARGTVALGWIQDHPSRWHTFVANRVAEIQTTVASAGWHHVPGRENPADCASRGLSPGDLINFQLWWRGPPWLEYDVSEWPTAAGSNPRVDLPEERIRVHATESVAAAPEEAEELLRFSSLHRLLRVTAWCRRWVLRGGSGVGPVHPALPLPLEGVLSVGELEAARLVWVRAAQMSHYSAEMRAVELSRALSKSSKLIRLSPFLDAQGILRVGGRLGHAVLSYDERHPVILPDDSHFTHLIVATCHRRALHGGVQLTLSLVRQQYWIPRGRSVMKRVIRRCVTCVRWRAASPQQRMADLPRERVARARAFLQTGVDYAGPIQLRAGKGRGQRAFKAFVAVFICLSTRAVHLEVVSDYSAGAFLAALRRFISRRGICCTLFSDCGTNFVGADAQLRAMFSASSPVLQQIKARTATEGISWRFNPPSPSAPHFGGIWEAAVRSLKYHLRRVLGDHKLTFEEMSTLLAQVEACLNSRPLQALSDDPDDLTALTPGHFLVGSALTAIPEPSLRDPPMNRLTRWQLLQHMRDHFWERWAKEYLHSLLHRPKWHTRKEDLRVGQLCLVRGDNTPPTR
ncbi:PREDICTED: uncharacterized protein LOC105557214 [Vollenhovia emeryi]|uniref:uncharacterized protein LOC105557214 n=1 Tax=Vollenhovia emeryi TaxID=411798 RepID=UPI0005F47F37|nr:PREDICTED: uncharacterized protein LOC105557214 [Vollenhovia emeryi]